MSELLLEDMGEYERTIGYHERLGNFGRAAHFAARTGDFEKACFLLDRAVERAPLDAMLRAYDAAVFDWMEPTGRWRRIMEEKVVDKYAQLGDASGAADFLQRVQGHDDMGVWR
jgi:hypothetical protein